MDLSDAIAIYLYLQHARPAYRDRHPAWRAATDVIAKRAAPIVDRMETADEQAASVHPVEPHAYVPSAMHMGDCAVCGHLQGDPLHSPFRQK